jgi:hypothetical protein
VHEGRLLEEIDRDQLLAKERLYVQVGVSDPERAATLLAVAGIAHVEQVDGRLRIFDSEARVAEIARVLVGAGLDVTELVVLHEDLEAHFLRLTGCVE